MLTGVEEREDGKGEEGDWKDGQLGAAYLLNASADHRWVSVGCVSWKSRLLERTQTYVDEPIQCEQHVFSVLVAVGGGSRG